VFVLGPGSDVETLPIASFVVEGVPHALVAARLSSEFAIGVRHGCFCAHPYLIRLLGLQPDELARFRAAARRHDHSALPGAVRASAGISTTTSDLERLLEAIKVVANSPPPVEYVVDPATGNYLPQGLARPAGAIGAATGCARG
jgi:selenocysteine lyase/cysteine desulfurase